MQDENKYLYESKRYYESCRLDLIELNRTLEEVYARIKRAYIKFLIEKDEEKFKWFRWQEIGRKINDDLFLYKYALETFDNSLKIVEFHENKKRVEDRIKLDDKKAKEVEIKDIYTEIKQTLADKKGMIQKNKQKSRES